MLGHSTVGLISTLCCSSTLQKTRDGIYYGRTYTIHLAFLLHHDLLTMPLSRGPGLGFSLTGGGGWGWCVTCTECPATVEPVFYPKIANGPRKAWEVSRCATTIIIMKGVMPRNHYGYRLMISGRLSGPGGTSWERSTRYTEMVHSWHRPASWPTLANDGLMTFHLDCRPHESLFSVRHQDSPGLVRAGTVRRSFARLEIFTLGGVCSHQARLDPEKPC